MPHLASLSMRPRTLFHPIAFVSLFSIEYGLTVSEGNAHLQFQPYAQHDMDDQTIKKFSSVKTKTMLKRLLLISGRCGLSNEHTRYAPTIRGVNSHRSSGLYFRFSSGLRLRLCTRNPWRTPT